MKRLFLSLILSLSLFCGSVFAANTIKYVSPAGTGDGSAVGTPDTFQDAYTALESIDGNHTIICVEAGTYAFVSELPYWDSAGDSLTIQAHTGLTAEDIIFDSGAISPRLYFDRPVCDLTLTNITFQGGESSAAGTQSCFIDGRNLTVTGCNYFNNTNSYDNALCGGAGLFIDNAITGDIVISDCTFDGNVVDSGGTSGTGAAIKIRGLAGDVTVSGCLFNNNTSNHSGGAVYIESTGTTNFSNNLWTNNVVSLYQGGALRVFGAAVSVTFDGETFTGNSCTSTGNGGAIQFYNGGYGEIKNCFFSINQGYNGGAIDFGSDGGSGATTSTLTNCVFTSNQGSNDGGAWNAGTNHSVNASHNSYYNNSCAGDGNHIAAMVTTTTLVLKNEIHQLNNIFESTNTDEIIYAVAGATLNINNCNIEGESSAVTNDDTYVDCINADPKYYSKANNDLKLRGSSPCIDQGMDASITHDFNGWRRPNGSAQDIGAYEFYKKSYGAQHGAVSTKTADIILTSDESGLVCLDSTAGDLVFYLPPLEFCQGLPFILHRNNGGANTITIYANEDGETIGGAASKTLTSQYDALWLIGGTSEWYAPILP